MAFLDFSDVNTAILDIQRDPRQIQSRAYLSTLNTAIANANTAITNAISAYNAVMQTTIAGTTLVDVTPDALKTSVDKVIDTQIDALASALIRLRNILSSTADTSIPIEVRVPQVEELIGSDGFIAAVAGVFIREDEDFRIFLNPLQLSLTFSSLALQNSRSGSNKISGLGVPANIFVGMAGSIIPLNEEVSLFCECPPNQTSGTMQFSLYLFERQTMQLRKFLNITGSLPSSSGGVISVTDMYDIQDQPITMTDTVIELFLGQHLSVSFTSQTVSNVSVSWSAVSNPTIPAPLTKRSVVNIGGTASLADIIEASNASPSRIETIITALNNAKSTT